MATIPLQLNILIDDEDLELCSKYIWSVLPQAGKLYIASFGNTNKIVILSRLLMGCTVGDGTEVDHINSNPLDNRKSNLRIVTRQQNNWNASKTKVKNNIKTSSKYKGVYWAGNDNKWRVEITKDCKRYRMGYFKNEEDAARAYNLKASELFGEYAKLNEIGE